jgi:uncharacterized protein involved in high-affinity Fe2+ transport
MKYFFSFVVMAGVLSCASSVEAFGHLRRARRAAVFNSYAVVQPVFVQRAYVQPVYVQPVYVQPVVLQQQVVQPLVVQPVYQQQFIQRSFVLGY